MDRKYWTRERILQKMREWNEVYGKPPTSSEWLRRVEWEDGHRKWPGVAQVRREFGSWSRGVRAAGFKPRTEKKVLKEERTPRQRHRDWTDEEILDCFREWAKTHRLPPTTEQWYGLIDYPAKTTVVNHFGSWSEAVRRAGMVPLPQRVPQKAVEALLPLPRSR